jgi:hypothetical protein
MKTPVLLLIFNRPNETNQVFNALKIIKPKVLYVAGDGPRADVKGDIENIFKTREILERIDWDCELKTLYRENNLGCKKSVSSAINWFFEDVEEGIILEDDCIPDESFFDYCTDLLDKYRDDKRVMHISGLNFLSGSEKLNKNAESYHFSKYPAVWGWATWKRAWELYDVDIVNWPDAKKKKLHFNFCFNKNEISVRQTQFDTAYNKMIDTWDYQWVYCVSMNNGLCITPNTNLISNIGFNSNATHTFVLDKRSRLSTGSISTPLTHPLHVIPEYINDFEEYFKHIRIPWYEMYFKNISKYLGVYKFISNLYHKIGMMFVK